MFSIYGISGQVFSGTLEQMNRVYSAANARSARAITEDGVELGAEAITGSRSREEAVDAYRAMLPRDLERGPLIHASQIMQRMVITVSSSDDVAKAWRTLRDNRISQAPVLNESAQLAGIVSERDLLTVVNIDNGQVVETLKRWVRDVMTTPVVTAAAITDIRRIAAVMLEHGVDGVPITNEGGRLVGFISRSDILRAIITDPPLSIWR